MSVYATLSADALITAIVNDEIHVSQAPQGTNAPYILLEFIGINPENYVDQPPDAENQRIAIKCIGTTQKQSIELYKLARKSLENIGQEIFVPIYGEFDTDTQWYLTLFDFSYWQNR